MVEIMNNYVHDSAIFTSSHINYVLLNYMCNAQEVFVSFNIQMIEIMFYLRDANLYDFP